MLRPKPGQLLFARRSGFIAVLHALLLLGLCGGFARAELAVQLFDTGSRSPVPLTADALTKRDKWALLPEDKTRHTFKGDTVVSNGKLVLVLRRQGRGAEVYAATPKGPVMRAELVPLAGERASRLSAVKIQANDSGGVALDATYQTGRGKSFTLGYELKLGQVFVQTEPRSGTSGLQVIAPCRFAVLPDFFADDLVVDARDIAAAETELPSENFLLHLVEDALVMAVWHPARDDVRVALSGAAQARTINSSEIHFAKNGKASVAILDAPGIWHMRDIAGSETNQVLRLNWKAPYPAHWRVDWRRDDKLIDSWEMLTQKPDGEYVKHGWYGQPESFGNVDWLKDGRKRWTTVLGSFLYPCWIDKAGEGYLQPLGKGVRFQGPAVIYPINRLDSTPLEAFTVVDVMRATLGVGPCEYILDVEGQKKTFQGRPTCASRTILDNIYGKKEQKDKRAEVQRTLDEVIAFVRHIRGRIEDYGKFGHELDAWLEARKQAQPALSGPVAAMQATLRRIDDYRARRKEGIQTPEFATRLVEDFRAQLVDYTGDDAVKRCKEITAALVKIGGNQDELVGECRMVVKLLRQQAAMAMAADPALAAVAREVRNRTQQMLRNPTSYEAPRH